MTNTTEGAQDFLVRGHICDGLRRFNDAATYVCIPAFSDHGRVIGCDDSNPIAITHCPFCGFELPPVEDDEDEDSDDD